jgi:hypothetical protein
MNVEEFKKANPTPTLVFSGPYAGGMGKTTDLKSQICQNPYTTGQPRHRGLVSPMS